jgi:ferredoxin
LRQVYEFKAVSVSMKNLINKAFSMYYKIDTKRILKEKCIQCGLCTKICPVENIKIVNGNVKWDHNCIRCFACLNWCPQCAIRFGRIKPGLKQQYHCPGVHASDVVDQCKSFNDCGGDI